MPEPNATPAPLTDRSPNDESLRGTLEVLDEYQRLTCDMDDPPPFPCSTRKVVELVESVIATRAKLAEAEALSEGTLRDVVIANTKLTAAESRVAALTEALTALMNSVATVLDAQCVNNNGGAVLDSALATARAALSPSQDAKEARDA